MKNTSFNDIQRTQTIFIAILGGLFLVLLVIGASFAYLDIFGVNNTELTITGKTIHNQDMIPVLETKTTALTLGFNQVDMSGAYVGKKFYATPSGILVPESEVALNNGRYILATASVIEPTLSYNCEFNYDISATITNPITDGSDNDVYVVITSNSGDPITYTLKEVLAGTKTATGVVRGINLNNSIDVTIEVYVLNTAPLQEDLRNNDFTITIEASKIKTPFSCNL